MNNEVNPLCEIILLRDRPELITEAAEWFSSKWNIPAQTYIDSMNEALSKKAVPAWYVVLNGENKIIAGIGVIENDFHKRPDLTPTICAVYVEEAYRRQGLAKKLLDRATDDLAQCGINSVYLSTAHDSFYEKCGWKFYGMVEETDGNMVRMYDYENKIREE